jgi:hypothetical protein
MFHRIRTALAVYFSKWLPKPSQVELVTSLVLNTASLEIAAYEHREFAPIKGTCGNIRLTGTSLPVFTYLVFDKKLMEFVEVRVEVSRPERIEYIARIKSLDISTDGKEVPIVDKYKAPFERFSLALYNYFPFPMPRRERGNDASVAQITVVQNQGGTT